MKGFSIRLALIVFAAAVGWIPAASADNQTATLSDVLPSTGVPFSI